MLPEYGAHAMHVPLWEQNSNNPDGYLFLIKFFLSHQLRQPSVLKGSSRWIEEKGAFETLL